MKKYFITIIAISLFSCNNNHEIVKENVKEYTKGFEPTINYYRDCRTGLCFAQIIQGNDIKAHTCVPCDSVIEYLNKCN